MPALSLLGRLAFACSISDGLSGECVPSQVRLRHCCRVSKLCPMRVKLVIGQLDVVVVVVLVVAVSVRTEGSIPPFSPPILPGS